jgi:hypothetical protein
MHTAGSQRFIITAAYEDHKERLLCNNCYTVLESGQIVSTISVQEIGHFMFIRLAGYCKFELLAEEFSR